MYKVLTLRLGCSAFNQSLPKLLSSDVRPGSKTLLWTFAQPKVQIRRSTKIRVSDRGLKEEWSPIISYVLFAVFVQQFHDWPTVSHFSPWKCWPLGNIVKLLFVTRVIHQYFTWSRSKLWLARNVEGIPKITIFGHNIAN